jgi:hypothetical protein
MTIDIEPTEREISDFERVFMEIQGYKEIYYFIQDGKQHSVWWTTETIKTFLPSWCVSEYIENHLQRYASIFAHCMCAWEHQKHPYWTVEQVDQFNRRTGVEVPMSIKHDDYVKRSARFWLKNSYEQFTKPLEFVVVKLDV